MAHFLKSGNRYNVFPGNALDISDNLPPHNYVLKFSPMEGFFLEQIDSFRMPPKIYGDCLKNSERIINTFKSRDGNTGVLLTGEKGSGKTLLARQVAIQSNLPVIIVNTDFKGDGFNSFLSSITQPCVVFLDEFEKIYDKDSQEKMLTLLDGTYQSKKLFLLTSNDKWRIDMNMRNRPGRIFYLIEFGGVDETFIKEYCQDNLENKEFMSEVIRMSKIFDVFSFDLLSSIVEESNRYRENPKDLLDLLNAKPEYSGSIEYSISCKILETIVPPGALSPNSYSFNTTQDTLSVDIWFAVKENEDSSILDADEVDWDLVIDMIKSNKFCFYNRNKYNFKSNNVFGDGSKFTVHSTEIYLNPEDITLYTPTGGLLYRPEEGVSVTLEKTSKSSKFRRPSL